MDTRTGRVPSSDFILSIYALFACLLFPLHLLAGTAAPGIRLISSDREGIVIEVELPEYTISERQIGDLIYRDMTIPGWGRTTERGRPSLPRTGIWLAIPPAAKATLHTENLKTIAINFVNPLPSPSWETDPYGRNPVEKFTPDRQFYSSYAQYPAQWAELGEPTWMRTFWVVPLNITPVQVILASGEAHVAQKLRLKIEFEGDQRGTAFSDPYGDVLARSTILNFEQAQGWRARPESPERSVQQALGQYKLLVSDDGLYVLTYADLEMAGIDPGSIDPQTIKIFNEGEEIPIWVEGEWDGVFDFDDHILFFGIYPRGTFTYENIYTDTNVYWLDWGGEPGLRLEEQSVSPGSAVLATEFKAHRRWEFDSIYEKFGEAPLTDDIDHWMWVNLDATYDPEFSYFPDLPGLTILEGQTYGITVSLRGETYSRDVLPDHHVQVYWNDYLAIDGFFERQEQFIATHGVPHTYIEPDDPNELIFRAEPVPGVQVNAFYLDWFQVDYWRDYSVQNDTLLFQNPQNMGPGNKRYEITGLVDPEIELWNLSRMERLIDYVYSEGVLEFQDPASDTTIYYVAGRGSWLTPEIIEEEPSEWSSPGHIADYLMITHENFYQNILPLADHYESQGKQVVVAKVGDVYDEFSNGIKTPQAIFDFITHAYYEYEGSTQGSFPAFVLLVGDASWDYKNNDPQPYIDYIPTHSFLTEKWGETSSDNWYASVSGLNDPLPDVFLGRLPVNTPEEADLLVNKAISYATAPSGYWETQVLFTNGAYADTDAVHFDTTVQVLIDTYFPEWYDPNRVYSLPSANYVQYLGDSEDLITYINQGAAMINYVGHAGNQMWETLDQSEITLLENRDKLPFVAAFSCFTGIFSNTTGFGEAFVLKEGGGAIGYWSNTGLGYRNNNSIINDCLFKMLYDQDSLYFGAAAAGAKWAYYDLASTSGNVIEIFTLLGDPAASFVFRDPVPDDTLDQESPVIEFLGLSEFFHDWDFINNPVDVTCKISDNKEIVLTSEQLEVRLTWLMDIQGNTKQEEWPWEWSLEDLPPPDTSDGHQVEIAFNDTLPAGNWEFYASAEDYLGNKTVESARFKIAGNKLAVDNPLYYNHPGGDETSFTFSLTQDATVTLKVYTVSGKLIWSYNDFGQTGYNVIDWDGHDQQGNRLSNGAYIYKIKAQRGDDKVEKIEKMLKIR